MTISYELALKLKKAGFPQPDLRNIHEVCEGWYMRKDGSLTEREQEDDSQAYVPTLSELIEHCGTDLQNIYRCKDGTWEAMQKDDKYGESLGFRKGSTPEEAVANLYVALKGKI